MSNPFLICTDRELRALPAQWLLAEKWDKAGAILHDVQFMNSTVQRLGVDELIQEYSTASLLLPKENIWYQRLITTNNALHHQAHFLRNWDSVAHPAFFLQQLRNECFHLNLNEMQMRLEKELTQVAQLYMYEKNKIIRSSGLLRSIFVHNSPVVLRDDNCLVSFLGNEDCIIKKVWDINTGRELRELRLPQVADVWGTLELSADGRLAIFISRDSEFTVLDTETGREINRFSGHKVKYFERFHFSEAMIIAIAVTPDGRLAITSSKDSTLNLFDVTTGRELHTLKLFFHRLFLRVLEIVFSLLLSSPTYLSDVRHIAMDNDGGVAVSANYFKNRIKVWNLKTGRVLRTLRGHGSLVSDIALSADGKIAISASSSAAIDNALKVWDVETGRELHTLKGHIKSANSVTLSADGRLALSAADNIIKIWDVKMGREIGMLTSSSKTGRMLLSADMKTAVSRSDNMVNVWDISEQLQILNTGVFTKNELKISQGHNGRVTDIAMSADGRLAISASFDNMLKVWDVETGRELRTLAGHSGLVTCVHLSADGHLAISGSFGDVITWDVKTGRKINLFTTDIKDSNSISGWMRDIVTSARKATSGYVLDVALSTDKRIAVVAFMGNMLKVLNIETGKELHTLNGHLNWVESVVISADGRFVVSASRDSTIKIWDILTGREIRTLKRHDGGSIDCIALSGNGRLAISASWDHTLTIWDTINGLELTTFIGHSNRVIDVAISNDGQIAISISEDHTIKVWNTATRQVLSTLSSNSLYSCCAFTQNKNRIVAGDESGNMHFLELINSQ